MKNRGGVEDTRLEAKAKDTKKNSRPRTDPLKAKDTDVSVFKKKVFKNFFQAISKKKVFKIFFSGDLYLRKPKKEVFEDFPQGFWHFVTKFQRFKNSAVLEPRTGQFSRT